MVKSKLALPVLLLGAWLGASAQVLPPPPPAAGRLSSSQQLLVNGYRFVGNTAFSAAELAAVVQPYAGRAITSAELEEARRAVTLHYIQNGYVTSGAVLPDQDPVDGIVLLQIVEGQLTAVELAENRWLRDAFIRSRVQRHAGPPLNIHELNDGLLQLRQNPNVARVNAEVRPGAVAGESVLDLRVTDEAPLRIALQVDNHRPPSVGAEQVTLEAASLNLTGHSDPLELRYGIATSGAADGWGFSGVDNVAASYRVPVTAAETTLGVFASREDSSLISEPLASLDIDSETVSIGGFVRQPLYRTAHRELAVTLAFDRRQNDTQIAGSPWPISPGADARGRTTVSTLRLSQEWTDRSQNQVLALRSTFNVGLDLLDATDEGLPGSPDATFVSWVGQAQYARRLFNTPNELIVRVTGQWTPDRLLALEQLSAGGADSVRGYRENQLVRDRGVVAGLELRLPVLFRRTGEALVSVAPFVDFGKLWNVDNSGGPETLTSVGLGLLVQPHRHVDAQLYWGHQLRTIDTPGEHDIQDLGLHFKVRVSAF